MDVRERFEDAQEALRVAMRGQLAGLWTALPGIVQSFDTQAVTVVVQPAIKGVVRQPNGGTEAVNLPLLADVPVYFPRGGGCTLTFPIQPGDECLLIFSARCIDNWWQSGGIQPPMERRMHDLSDGFALIGPFSQATKISGIHTQAVQLRSNDGQTFIALNPTTKQVKLAAPGGFEVDAPHTDFSGAVTIRGPFTFLAGLVGRAVSGVAAKIHGILHVAGQLIANGKRIDDSHTHSGVRTGGDTSGPVT